MSPIMKSRLYKLALFLLIISFIPFLIFISKRETPPEKINVPQHKTQTVENFILKSSGKRRWQLTSPKANFLDKNTIQLKKPVLTVFLRSQVVIEADEAKLDRKKGKVYLKNVKLIGKNFKAFSPEGVYLLKRESFKTNKSCKVTYNSINTSEGKVCTLDLKYQRAIISGGVKTVVREELK